MRASGPPVAIDRYRRQPVRRRAHIVVAALAAGALAAAIAPGATAVPPTAGPAKSAPGVAARSDVREIAPGTKFSTKKLDLKAKSDKRLKASATPAVGTTRTLVGSDDSNGELYKKSYTLQAVGDHIEVWVAKDTAFPAGDCRNQVAGSTTVTAAQAQELAEQFDDNIFPKESAAFSVAKDRDGTGNTISGVDPTGDGDKIMTLVDNIRDDNYYEGVQTAPTSTVGFFSSAYTELLDRNIMTIDAFDWVHRTGANPPDAPTNDPCTSRSASPYLYEATFAHEYQHLLENDQDATEVTWVNEGLSMFAETLTGYSDASKSVFQAGGQSYIYCYNGFGTVETKYNSPSECGGPENSLTLWGDQPGQSAILTDYGEAWSFMLFLYDRYGLDFMSRLHRDGQNQGLAGLQAALNTVKGKPKAYTVLHDFQLSTLVDKAVDRRSGKVTGIAKSRVTTKSLNSSVNLANPAAYAAPGAPPNGADYVQLRKADGKALSGKKLTSLSFSGDQLLPPEPLKWTSVTDAPTHGTNAALWSGDESDLDASAVTAVTVPAAKPTLTFDELHLAEKGYDYAYTLVSTDGGASYTPLANANTVKGPLGPALNGDATAFATQTFDLKAYAGKSILLAFRYVSDGGVNDGGWYVDNVKVGDTVVSDGSSVAPFKSTTQTYPTPIYGFTVRLVGIDDAKHKVLVKTYTKRSFTVSKSALKSFRKYPQVVAVVSYDEPTEQVQQQAFYTLKANKVVQPGGRAEVTATTATARR